jgi:hypothetical protein
MATPLTRGMVRTSLFESAQWVGREPATNPRQVGFFGDPEEAIDTGPPIHVERWRDEPTVAGTSGCPPHRRAVALQQVDERFPVLRHDRIEVDELTDDAAKLISDTRDHEPPITVSDQMNIAQIAFADLVGDRADVSRQPDVRGCLRRPIAEPGKGGGDDLMSGLTPAMARAAPNTNRRANRRVRGRMS